MKKVLLGTSALIAAGLIASPAAAQLEMSITGEIRFEAGVYGEANDDRSDEEIGHKFGTDVENIHINATGVSDTGIRYGGRIDLTDNGDQGLNVDEAYIFLGGGFGTVTLGNDDGASDISLGVPTAGTGIADGGYGDYVQNEATVLFQHQDDGDAAKINYSTVGVQALDSNNLTFGVSYAPDSDQGLDSSDAGQPGQTGGVFAVNATTGAIEATRLEPAGVHAIEVGAAWEPTFGAFTISPSASAAIAIDQNGNNQDTGVNWQVGLNVGTGGFDIGVNYVEEEIAYTGINNWGVNVGATYETGPWTFGVGYSFAESDSAVFGDENRMNHTYGAGVSYAWLPGLNIHADVVGFNAEGGDNTAFGRPGAGIGAGDADNSGVVGVTRVQLTF